MAAYPNIMVDNVVYWYVSHFRGDYLSEDFILLGECKETHSKIARTNLQAFGVAKGSKVYQSEERPGWIYVQCGEYYNLFTVWELCCPLLKYDDKLYISTRYIPARYISSDSILTDYIDDMYTQIAPGQDKQPCLDNFEYKGTLEFGEYNTVPINNMEANNIRYEKQSLFGQRDDSPVVYVLFVDSQNNTWKEFFYDVALIPIDYSQYLKNE